MLSQQPRVHPHLTRPLLNDAKEHEEKKVDRPASRWNCSVYNGLKMVALAIPFCINSGIETLPFYDGLKDVKGDLLGFIPMTTAASMALATFYFIQYLTVNSKYTKEGMEKVYDLHKGKPPAEWEKLNEADSKKANRMAAAINSYAWLADGCAIAYYLEQISDVAHFVEKLGLNKLQMRLLFFAIGGLTSSLNLFTEGWEVFTDSRAHFSKPKKTLDAALSKLHKSPDYAVRNLKEERDFWAEFSPHLKVALFESENENLLDAIELKETLLDIFKKNSVGETRIAFIDDLNIDPNIAKLYAQKFFSLKPHLGEQEFTVTSEHCGMKLLKGLLKSFSAAEDWLESYTTLAAMIGLMAGITSLYFRFFLLVVTLINGAIDLKFNGKNCSDAIDQFIDAVSEGTTKRQKLLFTASAISAVAISHADQSLLFSMLNDPEVALPFPFPPKLPESLQLFLGWGAFIFKLITYTYYLLPFFAKITCTPVEENEAVPLEVDIEQPLTDYYEEDNEEENTPRPSASITGYLNNWLFGKPSQKNSPPPSPAVSSHSYSINSAGQ